MDRRGEIRDFLVSRRARVTPEQAGLVLRADRPRRVPGLRREEVADLAGVSVDYYVQLERGDLAGASDGVLHALARALRLDEAERLHLFDLARSGSAAGDPATAPARVRPSVQRTLDAFTDGMALVRTRSWDYLAANHLARAVYAEVFEQPGVPNHIRYVFLDPRARTFFEDWPAVAHDTARVLRSEAGRAPQDPAPAALVEELTQCSPDFRAAWSRHDVRLPAAGRHRFHHPTAGLLELTFEAATLRADPGLTLLLATGDAGSETEAALRRLAA